MDDTEQQRTDKAVTPCTNFWEMLAKLTPIVARPDSDGEEVFQTMKRPRPQAVGQEDKPPVEEQRSSTAKDRQRALTARLMEQVCETENLNCAYARVKSNKGSPGVDGMSIKQMGDWLKVHQHKLIASLLDGSYQPQPDFDELPGMSLSNAVESRLRQCKRTKPIADFLQGLGVPQWRAWITALSGKGWWRLAATPSAHGGMNMRWFETLGFASLTKRYVALQG